MSNSNGYIDGTKCKNCGNLIIFPNEVRRGPKYQYCNTNCAVLFRTGKLPALRPTNCWYCNEALPDEFNAGFPRRYCSRKHAALYRQANRPKKPFVIKTCGYCNAEFHSNITAQKFCSNVCRMTKTAEIKALETALNKPEFYEYPCDRCSALVRRKHRVTKGKYGRFCDNCRLVIRRASYRVKTVKRQNAAVKPSRLSCDEIAKRDNYVCHICGDGVDMSLPRIGGLGATVDHVIPLSKGGSDEPDNLKLAHWVCNIKKSDKIYA